MTARAERSAPIVARRRHAFGLDGARQPAPARVEALVRRRLGHAVPDAVVLPAERSADGNARLLVLLLPGRGAVALRIGGTPGPGDADTLTEACRRCRIPVAHLARAEDLRAALRRLGVETEEA